MSVFWLNDKLKNCVTIFWLNEKNGLLIVCLLSEWQTDLVFWMNDKLTYSLLIEWQTE